MYLGGLSKYLTNKNVLLLLFMFYITITCSSTSPLLLPPSSSSISTTVESSSTIMDVYIEMMPEDQWVCGAAQWDQALSYQRTNESCRDVSWGINNCCAIHDQCYMLEKTQEECDVPFCACLEEQAQLSSNNENCKETTDGFCWIVQLLGGIAHSNAKAKAENTTLTLSTTETPPPASTTTSMITTASNTTLTPPPTTSSSSTTTSTSSSTTEATPRDTDITEEECFLPELNNCVAEFETCQSHNKLELLHCEERMCQCARAALRDDAKDECRIPLEMACKVPDSTIPFQHQKEEALAESLFSARIQIFGFSLPIFTTLILSLAILLLISFTIWTLYHYQKKRSMPISPSRTPLCASSSTDSGLGCGSNDTLSTNDGINLANYP